MAVVMIILYKARGRKVGAKGTERASQVRKSKMSIDSRFLMVLPKLVVSLVYKGQGCY